jgi:WD40-like Beta Propeller Repeat
VSHNGTTKLIAVVSANDYSDWSNSSDLTALASRVSPDGRWLAFMSERELTGYDNRDALTGERDQEVYLYDAQSARLACASCNPTGARPVGAADHDGLVDGRGIFRERRLAADIPAWTWLGGFGGDVFGKAVYQSRYLSDSGRLFFNSHDALVPQDVNGNWDVYQYEPPGVGSCSTSAATFSERSGGCVGLISSGTSSEESAFLDASATGGRDAEGHEGGGDVFFLTASKLSSQDYDTALDVYDAHECTGESPCLPAPAAQPPACVTEASCKASPTPQPGVYGLPSSATFSGPGNAAGSNPPVVTKKTVKCPKGKKLSHGKCVKVKAKRKKKAHKAKRASHDRRASR